jgi:hypothetical protein
MILSGQISRPGVASPARDVPAGPFFEALAARGLAINKIEVDPSECFAGSASGQG